MKKFGFEAEFCLNLKYGNVKKILKEFDKNIQEKIHNYFPFISNENYAYFFDKSIKSDRPGYIGVELISPVFENYNEYKDNISKVFSFIEKNGYTNGTCGFHFSLGLQNNINFKQVLTLIYKIEILEKLHLPWLNVRKKSNNFYKNKENWKILQECIYHIIWEKRIKNVKDLFYLEKEINKFYNTLIPYKNPFWKIKYANIAFEKADNKYLEFRFCGGENYFLMFEEVITTIQNTEKILDDVINNKYDYSMDMLIFLTESIDKCYYSVSMENNKITFMNYPNEENY